MRYRTGPVAGTITLAVLVLLGVVAEVSAAVRGESAGSLLLGVAVILVVAGVAAGGLNDLRGVRTERRPDGSAVLKLPTLVPTRGGWRTIEASEIDTVFLVLVGSKRSRLYNLAVTLRDGSNTRSGAVAVRRPVRVALADTDAAGVVEQINHDLGVG